MSAKNITLDGRPLIEVVDWNMQKDSISYNFCFPVVKSDNLSLNYKKSFTKKLKESQL